MRAPELPARQLPALALFLVAAALLAPAQPAAAGCSGDLPYTHDNCNTYKRYQCGGGTDCQVNDCRYGGDPCFAALGTPTGEETCNSQQLPTCAQRTTQSLCQLGYGCTWDGGGGGDPPPAGSPWPRNSGGAWVYYGGDASTDLVALKQRMATLKNKGAQYVRLWIPWRDVEPSRGAWSFDKFDRMIATIVAAGHRLEITLSPTMSPQWFWSEELLDGPEHPVLHRYCEEVKIDGVWSTECRFAHNLHAHDSTSVTNPHASIWAPAAVRNAIRSYVDETFDRLLDKWAPFILFVNPGLGRLNEPLYTDSAHFWSHDYYARADFRAKMEAKYSTIANLNAAWNTTYGGFGQVRPPLHPFRDVDTGAQGDQHMHDYLAWYRDAKRIWINRVTGWVQPHLHPWQRQLVYVAGGSGDVENLFAIAKTHPRPWNKNPPPSDLRPTVRGMLDNHWLLRRARDAGWYVRYAGIGGEQGCGAIAVCNDVPAYAAAIGYTGPLYAQIPKLTTLDQPATIAQQAIAYGYDGHHWNKDIHLFGSSGNDARLLSLAKGWQDLEDFYGGDYSPPVISGLSVSAGTNSATVTWTTQEAADSAGVWGPPGGVLNHVATYASALAKSHSIQLSALAAGTSYDVLVASTDGSGNTAVAKKTFTTAAAPPPPPPPPPPSGCQGSLDYRGDNCADLKRRQCGDGTDCQLNDCRYQGSQCFFMCHWQPGGETCEETCDAKPLAACSQRSTQAFCTAGWGCTWQ